MQKKKISIDYDDKKYYKAILLVNIEVLLMIFVIQVT